MVGLTTALDSIWWPVLGFKVSSIKVFAIGLATYCTICTTWSKVTMGRIFNKRRKGFIKPKPRCMSFPLDKAKKEARNMSVLPVCIQQGRPFDQIWRFVHKMSHFSGGILFCEPQRQQAMGFVAIMSAVSILHLAQLELAQLELKYL